MGFSVVQASNVVDKVMVQAGVSLANTTSFNTNPGSIAIHAGNALANAEKIGAITEQIAEQQPSGGPQAGAGSSMMNSVLTAGALALGMIVAPGPTAAASLVASVGQAVHFGLKGNVGQGELTIANVDAATAFDKGVYVSAYDGQTSDVATGKPVATSSPAMGQAAPASKGMHNFSSIVAEATAGVDPDKIKEDIMARFKEQKDEFGRDMRRLREMGAIRSNDPNALAAEERMAEIGDTVKLAVAKPRMAGGPILAMPSLG